MLGNQKAGTSAVAGLLGMATGRPTTLDLRREVGKRVYPRIVNGELEFEDLIRRNPLDFSRPIVKEPNLTLFYDDLRKRFPHSRFVFVVRDPRDNIRSLLNRLRIAGDLDLLTPAHCTNVDPGFALLLDGRWCGIDADPHYIDQLAERWNVCADVYLDHSEDLALLRYEDFRTDRKAAIEDLARRLDLEVERDISNKVDIQFQRAGDLNVSWSDFFGANLARIENCCRERMSKFSYAC